MTVMDPLVSNVVVYNRTYMLDGIYFVLKKVITSNQILPINLRHPSQFRSTQPKNIDYYSIAVNNDSRRKNKHNQ